MVIKLDYMSCACTVTLQLTDDLLKMTPRPDAGRPDFIEAVFTCRGNFYDPNFPNELERLNRRLQTLLKADKQNLVIKKVEPWNSVKVTVNIPKEAAERLKVLAQQNNGAALRNLGIMSLQMEGDRIISLTLKSPTKPVNTSTEQLPSFHGSTSDVEHVSSDSHRHNLLTNSADASHTSPHITKGVTMQLPVDKVPPLVLNKSKLEKRQRKSTSSKSRSKSKSSTSINSNTNSAQSTAIGVPAEPDNNSELREQTTSPTMSPAFVHPALKDAELPASSNLTDQETVNGLLTTLFKRSLDPKNKPTGKSLTSSLHPQSAKKRRMLQHPGQLNHTQSSSNSYLPAAATSSPTLRPSACLSNDSRPTSEHVSVIARAQTTNIQTEAMDLSGPGNSYFSKPKSPVLLPMDLSDPCSKTPTLSQNSNNNRELHKHVTDPSYSMDKPIVAFTGGTLKSSSADQDKTSSQLSNTKATSVTDNKSSQVSSAGSECSRLTTPTDSSQLLTMPGSSCHAAEVVSSDRQSSAVHCSEVTNGRVPVVHGKPVSVICSPMDDRSKSNSMSSNSPDDKHSSFAGADVNRCKDNSSLLPLGGVIVQPTSSDANGSHVSHHKSRTSPESDGITNSFCTKYNGPTQQHLTTTDHEPVENGSSTSTDSGVVTASPKSDICATPPAVEEEQVPKNELQHSSNPALIDTSMLKDVRLLRAAAPAANATEKLSHSSLTTLDGTTLVINTSRPSVSILRPVRPRTSGQVKNLTSATSTVSLVKSTDPQTGATDKLTQLPHTSVPKDLSYLVSNQDSVSDVFLSTDGTDSCVAPIRVTLSSNKDRPLIKQHRENSTTPHSHTVASIVYSAANKAQTLVKKCAENSELADAHLPNVKHRIVHELMGKAVCTEASSVVASTNHGNGEGDVLNLSTSLLNERLTTSVVTWPANSRNEETKTSVCTPPVDPPSKATTVIVSTRTGASLPAASVESSAQELQTAAHNLNSLGIPITTQKNISSVVSRNSRTVTQVIATTNNASLNQHQVEQAHSVGEVGIDSQVSHNSQTHKPRVPELGTLAHTTLDNVSGRQMVNGTSDCGGSECTDVMGSSEAMSPESFTSGCASLEADIPGVESSGHLSGSAAGQPRKSGRVRVLKSPDPDYVTPKARKRGSRTSEGSNNSDLSGPVKKNSKPVVALPPGHTDEPVTEPLTALNVNPTAQMNGPTSQAKRSTRSSGLSDLQALPTVYRERKRSKR